MNQYNVIVRKSFQADVDCLFNYLKERYPDYQTANNFLRNINDAIEMIRYNPYAFCEYEYITGHQSNIRRAVINKYLAFYVIFEYEYTVVMLRLLDGRRSVESILSELDEIGDEEIHKLTEIAPNK